MSHPPLIGITPDYDRKEGRRGRVPSEGLYYLNEAYVTAIQKAGGTAVVLPYTDDAKQVARLAREIDGAVLTGGAFDIDPKLYGQKPVARLDGIKPNRTGFEWTLFKALLRLDKPVLAICGGEQLINVALGGTLLQDIPEMVPGALVHEQKKPKDQTQHWVNAAEGSLLARATGSTRLRVNSTHHQGVDRPGRGLCISGTSPDGVIEAIEMPRQRWVLGVEWHPELLAARQKPQAALFRHFVKACQGR